MKKIAIVSAILLFFTMIILAVFLFVQIINQKVEKADFYYLSGENIPSIKYVVGERNINKLSSSEKQKQYHYSRIKDKQADLAEYVLFLCGNENFIKAKDADLSKNTGKIQLTRPTVKQADKQIVIDISFSKNKYVITLSQK